ATALGFLPAGPDGWQLAAAGDDGAVRLFDRDGRDLQRSFLGGHTGPVEALAAGPDGLTLVSGGQDAGVCVWDVPTGSVRLLLRGHDHPVRAVRFGPDGQVYTGSDDGAVKAWDLKSDPEGPSDRNLAKPVFGLAVRPDGPGFVAAFADGSVAVYAQPGGTPQVFPQRGHAALTRLAYSADGVPTGVEIAGAEAVVWEFGRTARAVYRARATAGASVTAVDLADVAGRLAVGDDRGRVTVWSLADKDPVGTIDTGTGGPVRHLCLSDNGRWVAAQRADRSVGVWEVGSDRTPYRVPAHPDGLWLVRFLPGGDRLVSAGKGSSIKVWRVATGREELALLGHVGRVSALAVSPDGRTLASGSQVGEVKLWDLWTGQELVGLKRHGGPVRAAEFGADGRLLVTGGDTPAGKGELVFWEAAKE
ncbi:MAG: WD40 repeat domain-containing protein, partial [Gemmataceae bacterium]|nr:WD40 repeat domain-containing protein [Gemmataceae bacterium]